MADNIKLTYPVAEEAIAKLKAIEENFYDKGDRSAFHEAADQALVDLIEQIGLGEVAAAYKRLRGDDDPNGRLFFWYS